MQFLRALTMIFSVLFNVIVTVGGPTCDFSMNQNFANRQPVLVQTKGDKTDFVLPVKGTDQIVLQQNETIDAYCPGSFVLNRGFTKEKTLELKCSGKSLKNKKKTVNPFTLQCRKSAKNTAQYTGWECYKENKEFSIGFRYKKTFLPLITGCFDKKEQITLYTVHTISGSIGKRQMFLPKHYNWLQGRFFNVTGVNHLYSRSHQQSTINDLLGLAPNSTKYISMKLNHYLTQGQLAPKADFLFVSQQRATYYLLNAVPQWKTLTRGNWQILETSLRKLAARRRIDLQIYSGVYRTLYLPHEHSGMFIKLYLSVRAGKYRIPVPEYIWKVAYDRESEAGVAFVAVNSPYLLRDDLYWYKICKNVCLKIGYVNLSADIAKKGYVYCCDVNELRKRVKSIPTNFTVKKLLI